MPRVIGSTIGPLTSRPFPPFHYVITQYASDYLLSVGRNTPARLPISDA